MTVIRANNISLSYSMKHGILKSENIEAVRELSFVVNKGEMFSIIGFNGSGKTTTLMLVSGILKPDSGNIEVFGKVVPFLGLGIGFNPELTGRENVFLYGAIMGMTRSRIDAIYDSIVDFSELGRFMDMKIKEYSSGMYVRLGFSVAIHTDPDILIIDEVLAVGDIGFQRKCLERIERMKEKGISILFVSHDLGLISRYSDRVMLLDGGKKISEGMPDKVIDKYLHLRSNVPTINASRRGSREVEFLTYKLDREDPVYSNGELITIFADYKNNSALTECISGFALYNDSGVLISGPNIRDIEGRFLNLSDNGRIEMSFSSEKLNPGKYYLSIALYDKTNRFPLDHIDYALNFRISGESRDYMGFLHLDAKWRS